MEFFYPVKLFILIFQKFLSQVFHFPGPSPDLLPFLQCHPKGLFIRQRRIEFRRFYSEINVSSHLCELGGLSKKRKCPTHIPGFFLKKRPWLPMNLPQVEPF